MPTPGNPRGPNPVKPRTRATRSRGPRRRGYHRGSFPTGATFDRYLLDRIPPKLWRQVRRRSVKELISIRFLLLSYLQAWLKTPGAREAA